MRFMRQLSEPAPLFEMPEGRPLRITDVQGSPDLRSRLYAMGLLPGTTIKICNRSCGQGSLCVRVRHCSLVIGEALARAIVCRPDSGHGHGHGREMGRDRDVISPECGPCPRPEGVDIMDLRECACPDGEESGRGHEAGGQGGGGQSGGGHGAGSRGGRGQGGGGCGGGGHGAGGQGGKRHGGRWSFFGC